MYVYNNIDNEPRQPYENSSTINNKIKLRTQTNMQLIHFTNTITFTAFFVFITVSQIRITLLGTDIKICRTSLRLEKNKHVYRYLTKGNIAGRSKSFFF